MRANQELERPDLVKLGSDRLSPLEKAQIRFIRHTFESEPLDRAVRICQRFVGSRWITYCTDRLTHLHGIDRVPRLAPHESVICVANHRSFFDLYIVTANLVRQGLEQRIIFPVRSEFFYDKPLGFVVNGAMSFFAMYPPIFRERSRAALNLASLDELAYRLSRGGTFVGIHPEGTRKKDDDPYTFLPAQSGVGRVIHKAKVRVLPVFINGLINDIALQVKSNFDGTGAPINIVFGEPLDVDDLLAKPGSPKTYKAIAERCLEAIGSLGQEEKAIRAQLH
ncbi:MAG: 1-acyl-sn-glycerol-3-phosphate acyltransferase [Polyangiaceae bacterium]|nr:1-acyl-sn-glycerol-3-phosphate acyltransferase [Polyangiaceae bacterium]MCB9607184.1 1-acyl-sn-glycerol-3-phosphate acyltransferase [Polyangiaceae bacterium]